MLTLIRKAARQSPPDGRLVLTYDERQRLRWRTRTAEGEEVALALPRGTVLADGDLLEAADGRLLAVVAADEELLEVRATDAERSARAAYHLGNRHALLEVGHGLLRTPANAVIETMLVGLGFAVRRLRAPFQPEPGAYAGGAHAHSSEARHAGVIHEFHVPRDEQ